MDDAETPDEAQAIYDKIQGEDLAKGILARGPYSPFLASIPAAMADPTVFIPVVGATTKLGNVARIAALGAGQALITEGVLQQTQLTRDMTDSAINVAASGFISGGLGLGVLSAKARYQKRRLQAERAKENAEDIQAAKEAEQTAPYDEDVAKSVWNETAAKNHNAPTWDEVKDTLPQDFKDNLSRSTPEEIETYFAKLNEKPNQDASTIIKDINEEINQGKARVRESAKADVDEATDAFNRTEAGERVPPTRAEVNEEEVIKDLQEEVNNEASAVMRGKDPVEENTPPIERSFNNIIDDDYYQANLSLELPASPTPTARTRQQNFADALESEELTLLGPYPGIAREVAQEIREKGASNLRNRNLNAEEEAILREALEIRSGVGQLSKAALDDERLKRWASDVERLDATLEQVQAGIEVNVKNLPSRVAAVMEASRAINHANRITYARGDNLAYAGTADDFKGGMMLPNGDIYVGKESKNFTRNLMHEVGHNLIFNNIFRKGEVDYLREVAKRDGWLDTFKVNNRWSDAYKGRPDKEALFEEEAIVEAFANWVVDPRPIKDNKVIELFQKLKSYLREFIANLNEGVLGNPKVRGGPKDFVLDKEAEKIFAQAYEGGRLPEGYPEGKLELDEVVEDVAIDDMRFERIEQTEADLNYEHLIKYRPADEAAPITETGEAAVETFEYKPSLAPEDTRLWRGRLGISEYVNKGYGTFKGAVGFLSSSQRASLSPFPAAREFNFRLNNVENQPLAGHAKGKTLGKGDVETRTLQEQNRFTAKHLVEKKKHYGSYRKRIKEAGDKPLSRVKFDYEVGRVLRTGRESDIPEVNTSANNSKSILDHWNKEMERVGLEVKPRYYPTNWNRRAIEENQQEFIDALMTNKGITTKEEAYEFLQRTLRENNGTRITSPYKTADDSPIEIDLNNEALDKFFEDDIDQIIDTYLRTVVPDVQLKDMFGTINPSKLFEKYIYEDMQKAIKLNPKDAAALSRKARSDIVNLSNQVDELRGLNALGQDSPYAGLARVERGLRQYSFSNLLGGVTVSSLPELARLTAMAGFNRAFGTYAKTFGGNLKALKASKDEAIKQGAVIDMINASHTKINLGDDNLAPGTTKAERALEWNAKKMGVVTGLTHYTDATKIAASAEINDFILNTALKVEKGEKLADLVNQRDIIRLARIGIDEDVLKKIATEKANFQNNNGLLLAGIETWKDAETAAVMRNAVVKEVLSTIITPRPSNRPAWANKALVGRSLYFLKAFLFASDSHILQSNLAYADGRTLAGATMSLGLGMIVTALKDLARDGEVKDRSTRAWLTEAVDRSGLLGSLFFTDTVQAGITGHSLQAITSGAGKVSRYQERGLEGLLGPIYGGISKQAMQLSSNIWDGYLTENDFTRFKRALPFQNHFALNYALNSLVDNIAESRNLPKNLREAQKIYGEE